MKKNYIEKRLYKNGLYKKKRALKLVLSKKKLFLK